MINNYKKQCLFALLSLSIALFTGNAVAMGMGDNRMIDEDENPNATATDGLDNGQHLLNEYELYLLNESDGLEPIDILDARRQVVNEKIERLSSWLERLEEKSDEPDPNRKTQKERHLRALLVDKENERDELSDRIDVLSEYIAT